MPSTSHILSLAVCLQFAIGDHTVASKNSNIGNAGNVTLTVQSDVKTVQSKFSNTNTPSLENGRKGLVDVLRLSEWKRGSEAIDELLNAEESRYEQLSGGESLILEALERSLNLFELERDETLGRILENDNTNQYANIINKGFMFNNAVDNAFDGTTGLSQDINKAETKDDMQQTKSQGILMDWKTNYIESETSKIHLARNALVDDTNTHNKEPLDEHSDATTPFDKTRDGPINDNVIDVKPVAKITKSTSLNNEIPNVKTNPIKNDPSIDKRNTARKTNTVPNPDNGLKELETLAVVSKRNFGEASACTLDTIESALTFAENIETAGGEVVLVCRGNVLVNKCEGMCNSNVWPDVNHYDGYQKECSCCRDASTRQRDVTISSCTIGEASVTGHFLTRTIVEPASCSCLECRN